jgi:replicative DNA helicase/5S rRNA maturation endonuclease (ribonuclease M5)
LRTIWNCGETEALKQAGYILDKEAPAPAHQEQKKNTERQERKPEADYTSLYRKWHEELKTSPEALKYLHGRGITDDSIDRFNLGYCAAWKHSRAGEQVPSTKRIIIPRTKGTYTARRIDKPATDIEANYIKQVQGRQKDLFNLEALDGAETPIICEGELDTISLYQAGAASVVGIGTTTNAGTLLEEAKKHPEAVYILALDNDPDKEDGSNPGKEAQMKLAADMKAAGLAVLNINPADIYGEAKDGNEAFTKDPERLGRVIAYLQGKAQEMKAGRDEEREAELRKRTGEGMLEDFLLSVTDTEARTYEPIPTGITDIDRALEGGFIRGTLVTLGAPPAMGKTALSQWIFENIATGKDGKPGHDVLYINLEMSREQLLARSLSRIAWKYEKKDFSALEVLRGYAWTDEQREAITKAAARYKADIAPNFIYNPDGITNNIDSILTAMEAETARLKAQGKPAPLVCIDYLQLVDSGERDAIEGMKGVIFKLKDFAKRENTVVFVIIANNRASNKTGTVEMESGRDTSAIEYSGDIMLGLAYTAIEDRREYEYTYEDKNGNEKTGKAPYDLDTIRRLKKEAYEAGNDIPAVCNEVSLKVLKSRFTEAERRANLIFDGKHSTFNQIESEYMPGSGTGWTVCQGKTPFEK